MIKKIYSILALLCLAVSGAWAADTYTITATVGTQSANLATEATLPYETTLSECYQTATGSAPNAALSVSGASVTSGTNVTVGALNGWSTTLSVSAEGESVLNVTLNFGSAAITITATKNAGGEPDPESSIVVTPTENENEWTFEMPAYAVEVNVVYETDLALNEEDDNTDALEEWDGYEADVTLTRTLSNGGWNTFAAPFDVDANTLAGINATLAMADGGLQVKQLESSEFDSSIGKLTLNFVDATSIQAGMPYLVKVSPTNVALASMPFSGSVVSKTAVPVETSVVDFIPTLGKTTITGEDPKTVLFLAAGNKLKNPTELPSDMKGFRAYFQLKGDAADARSFSLNIDNGETTGIETLDNLTISPIDQSVYDLQGRRIVNGQSLKKGVYVVKGSKTVVK